MDAQKSSQDKLGAAGGGVVRAEAVLAPKKNLNQALWDLHVPSSARTDSVSVAS